MLSFSGMAEVLGWPTRPPLVAEIDRPRVLESWAPHCQGLIPRQRMLPFAAVRNMSPAEFVALLADHLKVERSLLAPPGVPCIHFCCPKVELPVGCPHAARSLESSWARAIDLATSRQVIQTFLRSWVMQLACKSAFQSWSELEFLG